MIEVHGNNERIERFFAVIPLSVFKLGKLEHCLTVMGVEPACFGLLVHALPTEV